MELMGQLHAQATLPPGEIKAPSALQ